MLLRIFLKKETYCIYLLTAPEENSPPRIGREIKFIEIFALDLPDLLKENIPQIQEIL